MIDRPPTEFEGGLRPIYELKVVVALNHRAELLMRVFKLKTIII